jgi:hypothetical protein
MNIFYNHFLSILLFAVTLNGISNIVTHADTTPLSSFTVYASLITDNGTFVHVSVGQSNSYPVKKYSISGGVLTYINDFVDPQNSIIANRLFIFDDSFLIAYSTTNLIYNIFSTSSFSFIGTSSLN